MVAGLAPVFGKQARRTVLLEATQQTKYLAPPQPDQHTGVTDTQTTRLNSQQHPRRLNSCLLIDNTATTMHLPGPQNPGECHLYFAEGCHLYIALTVKSRRTDVDRDRGTP